MSRFDDAARRFAALHEDDPRSVLVGGSPVPFSADYHRRLSRWVLELDPDASEPVRLAALCQHVRRWTVPRASYPAGPLGYKRWRSALAQLHAEIADGVLGDVGFDAPVRERVHELLLKKDLAHDVEVQRFEDAICLTFLEGELVAFVAGRDAQQVIGILQKTWAKMSPLGRAKARDLAARLPDDIAALVGPATADAD